MPIDPLPIAAHSPHNERVITIIGEAGAGKSLLGENLARYLSAHGYPSLHVSCGHLFRALGVIAAHASGPRHQPDVAQILIAAMHRLCLVAGRPHLDGQPLGDQSLRDPGVERLASVLGGEEAAHEFVLGMLQTLRDQLVPSGTILVIDGRGLHQDFPDSIHVELTVSPAVASQRTGRPIADLTRRNDLDRSHHLGLPSGCTVVLQRTVDALVDTDPLTPDQVLQLVLPPVLALLD